MTNRAPLLAFLIASAAGSAAAQPIRIGAAGGVQGKVQAFTAGEPVGRIVSSGKPMFLNDHVTTDAAGKLQVLLLDQTVFTLGPDSDMVLDEFVYDPKTGAGKITAEVTKGVFRFVTGKIAGRDPAQMKVKVPTGTIGIRGTIAVGMVNAERAVIGLAGPGPLSNTNERRGGLHVVGARGSVEISRPGWGTIMENGKAPTPSAPLPPELADQIYGALASAPKKGAAVSGLRGVGRAPATQASGQSTFQALQTVFDNKVETSIKQTLEVEQAQSAQDFTTVAGVSGAYGNISTWEQLATLPGSFTYNGSGTFVQTLCGGNSCSNIGSYTFSVLVDFAGRDFTVSSSNISTGGVNSIATGFGGGPPVSFGTGVAFITAGGGSQTSTFVFKNSGGQIGSQLVSATTFNDGTNGGSGAAIATKP